MLPAPTIVILIPLPPAESLGPDIQANLAGPRSDRDCPVSHCRPPTPRSRASGVVPVLMRSRRSPAARIESSYSDPGATWLPTGERPLPGSPPCPVAGEHLDHGVLYVV